MKVAVWYGQEDVRVEDRESKELKNNEVKVKVSWAGICDTDLHGYLEGPVFISTDKPDPFLGQKAPVILGHEFSGTVEGVGKNVTKYKKDGRVVVNPTVSAREKEENLDLYDGYTFIGLGSDSGFAEFTNAPEDSVYHLPENVSAQESALVEPTAVTVQAVKEGNLLFGDAVAIFGAGPIGLLTVVVAKAAGASKIFVFDLSEERLAKAKGAGATHVINSGHTGPLKFVNEHIGNGVDVTFEVAGVGVTLAQSVKVARPRGSVVIVSIFAHEANFGPMLLTNSGVKLTSTIVYTPTTFQQAIDLTVNGSLDVKSVVTDKIELADIAESGFSQLVNDKSQAKTLAKLNGDQKY